ncbi:MAG: glycosyltransferase [Bacteroidetes bacterium]|nr:glycosyltransferase [Bacteroidota bacterium]
MQRIKIMLPAYNEALSLPPLLDKIEAVKNNFHLNLELLVVNDGSTDSTVNVVERFRVERNWVKLLDLQPNRGLAGAMREGLKEAVRDMADEDILITMDADNSHNPALSFRMITQIREGSDIVIASRYRAGARIVGLTRFRRFLSSVAGYLFRIFAPFKGVRDYTCGYRAYKVALIKKAQDYYQEDFIRQQGFGCMAEILLKMRRFRPVIHELPFILRYDQKQGESKMKVWKTIRQTLSLILSNH